MDTKNNTTADNKRQAEKMTYDSRSKEKIEVIAENLKYNEEENSFEIDVESTVKGYNHPSSYDTAAKDGDDMDSDWDEANPYVGDEYEDKPLAAEFDEQGMRIDEGRIIELDSMDERLADVPEDKHKDLDEEGYPKNDEKMP